jgi:hypothetical protein
MLQPKVSLSDDIGTLKGRRMSSDEQSVKIQAPVRPLKASWIDFSRSELPEDAVAAHRQMTAEILRMFAISPPKD